MSKTKTNEEFINEIKEKVGDEYTPLEEYITNCTKILMRHNKCGHEWKVRPNGFLRGTRCPKCQLIEINKRKTMSNEEFIEKVMKEGNGEYTPLEEYKNVRTKILMRHNTCGHEWKVIPSNFLRGTRCPKCAGNNNKKLTNEEFIERVKEKVGDEYTPLEEYKGINNKILIRHNKCGHEWKITPDSFLNNGTRCPKCQFIKRSKKRTMTNEEFIERVMKEGNGEYTPLEECINSKTKILIRHNKCGHEWKITPNNFLSGTRCPKCQKIKSAKKITMTNEEFIERVMKEGNGEYTPLEEYINTSTKILIRHNKCGHEWKTTPTKFLSGRRCPKCNQKKGESYIYNWLTNHNITFEKEYNKYKDCYWKTKSYPLKFDFRIPIKDKDILIEFDGIQHFKPVDIFGGKEGFKETKIRDSIKNKYCQKHENIDLYRIHYLDYPILDDILTCIMEKYKEDLT